MATTPERPSSSSDDDRGILNLHELWDDAGALKIPSASRHVVGPTPMTPEALVSALTSPEVAKRDESAWLRSEVKEARDAAEGLVREVSNARKA